MAHTGCVSSKASGLPGAPQCLQCHTLPNTSELQPVVRRPVRGSSFPGTSCWVLPKLHFPAGGAAHALLRTRTLPAQNGDFVWHQVLGTLLGLFLGTGPAGQVCRSMTHSDALRSLSLLPLTPAVYPPDTPPPAGPAGSLPFPPPHKSLQKTGLPKRSSLAFVICRDENDFLPASVDGITAGFKEPHPSTLTSQSFEDGSPGDSPGSPP